MVGKEIIVMRPYIRNSEEYYKFLEERVNSHAIGSKLNIPCWTDSNYWADSNYWDTADLEGYVAIKYSYGDVVANDMVIIEILRHYERPFSEICSEYYN